MDESKLPNAEGKRLSQRRFSSGWLHCLVSLVASAGSWAGYRLWFTVGGWHRQDHTAEGMLWALSAVIGIWGAVDAIRFARRPLTTGSAITMLAGILLGLYNILSFLLFLMFLNLLRLGIPR
jgi:hypothetical protein